MKINVLFILMLLLLVQSVFAQRLDSDGDGILDDFDNCPDTNPNHNLPIVLRNPEFLGCSCPQIFNLMQDEYCQEVFCLPNRPLEIRDRSFSARQNPCPPPRCEGNTLIRYDVDSIRCVNGVELPYVCEEQIIENAEFCINKENESFGRERDVLIQERDMFDLLTRSYLEGSRFVELLDVRDRYALIENQESVLRRLSVERDVEISERVINDRLVFVVDVSLVVRPSSYFVVDDFVLIEQIKGDITNKNLVMGDELFFDDKNQLIVWVAESVKDEVVFNYRITPGADLDFEFVIQGEPKSLVFRQLILPILLLVLVVGFFIGLFINMKEKNKIFKS